MNQWQWLIDICNRPESRDINGEAINRDDWKFFPGIDGEPWVSYQIVSHIVRIGVDAVRKKSTKLRKHPAFSGLIKMTDFERVYGNADLEREGAAS